jgi:hypothetical protein
MGFKGFRDGAVISWGSVNPWHKIAKNTSPIQRVVHKALRAQTPDYLPVRPYHGRVASNIP